MNAIRQFVAHVARSLSFLILGLVFFFPAFKGVGVAYLPLGVALVSAVALARRLAGGWDPFRALQEKTFRWFVFGGPALAQVVLLLLLRPEPLFDGRFVFEEAVAFAHTGHMPPLTYYPPAQTWWYAAWFKVFGATPLIAQLSHLPLHAFGTALAYGVAREIIPSRARVAAVLVAWYPSSVAYVLTTPYYHYLYTAMVIATAWGLLASASRPRAALYAGLASGLGALTKATQLIAPAQALVYWWLAPETPSHGLGRLVWRNTFLFVVGLTLVVAPWTARNWRVFRDFVPVCTSGGLVLYSANNPDSNGLYSGLPDTAAIRSPAEMLAHSRACAANAKQFILENPRDFLRLAGIKVLHTWGGEATFAELINRRGQPLGWIEDIFSVLFFSGWAFVVTLWAASSLRAWRARVPLTPLELAVVVAVLSNVAVYAVFEGGDRHHLPMVPLIVVAAIAGCGHVRSHGNDPAS